MQKSFLLNKIIYLLLLSLVLIDRAFLLKSFTFNYVGNDDLIFWQAATDYMHGIFHEPYFYGQNYNFMLESVFAIPFLKLGVPYNYTFPICSSIISLFPFFLFSFVLFKKNHIIESLCFLAIPLLLPIEYGMLTSITRGFASGLFFSSFFIFAILEPTKKSSWIIGAFAFSLGYIVNPNSIVFSLLGCLYLFLTNYKRFSFYWINLVIFILVFALEYFAKRFYITHPVYVVHEMWDFGYSSSQLIENLSDLNGFYGYFTPLLWTNGWFIIIVIFIIGILLLSHDWKKAICLILGVVFIIAALGVNKVNDRIDTLFLSSTRMFLGIPLLAGLAFFWGKEMIRISDKYLKSGILIVSVLTIFIKINATAAVVKKHTSITNYGPVAIKNINELSCDCANIDSICKKYQVDLIVFVPGKDLNVAAAEFYNYACPLLEKTFPTTLMNIYERRTWLYLHEKSALEKTVLVYDNSIDMNRVNALGNFEIVSTTPLMVIFKKNRMTTEYLLKYLGIDLKRDPYKVTKAN